MKITGKTNVRPSSKTNRTMWILLLGMIGLIAAMALSLRLGTKTFQIETIIQAIFTYNPEITAHQIVRDIRFPRALGAALIGAFLALSGAIMQALTRNPLAEPSLLGVSHGAAFALVLTLVFFPKLSLAGTTAAAMAGAGLTVLFIFSLTARAKGGITPVKLALAGIAIGMFLSSLTSSLGLYFNVAKDMSFWYAGGLAYITWSSLKILSAAGVVGVVIVTILARSLTLLGLGVDVTKGLGINLHIVRILGVLAVLLLTGSSVAVSGAIGFIGLVIPHISRMLVGSDYRLLLPVSALLGSVLLVTADVGARLINPPYETTVGIVTAAIGVPFFLYLVRNEGSRSS